MPPVDAVRAAPAPALPPILAAPKSAPRVAPGTALNQAQQHAASAPFRAQEALHSVQPTQHPSGSVRPVSAPVVVHSAAPVATGLGGHETETNAAQRHQAALALISLRHMIQAKGTAGLDTAHGGPHTSGGGLLGAIEAPVSAIGGLAHTAEQAGTGVLHGAEHLGSDIVNLPASTIQSLWELGKAPIQDAIQASMNLAHGASATQALPQSRTEALAKGMAQQDPLFQLATLHPGKAAELAYKHPLTAIADLGLASGAIGRLAGAGARAAGVAEHLSPLARAPLELPGGIHPIERQFSPNLITAAAQHALDARGNPIGKLLPSSIKWSGAKYPISGFEREMYRRGNEHQLLVQSLKTKYENYVRDHPDTGPTAKPIEHQVRKARADAGKVAFLDTIRQNALTNPRTKDIFYSGKKLTTTRAMDQLAQQGHDFVRIRIPRSTLKGRSRSVVIPKALHDTLQAHEAMNSAHVTLPGKVWQFGTQRFRRTVLPFSTKWIMGNTTEATLRSGLRGIMPQHERLGTGLVNNMREQGLGQEADRLEAQSLQGTHFSMQKRNAAKYTADHPITAVRGAGKVMHGLGKPADVSFGFNQRIEQGFARAALGKHATPYLKRIRQEFPNATKAEQMDMLGKLYGSPTMAASAGRFGRSALGQYSAFGPGVSNFTHKIAPFSPWYGNSVKFMGTLPFRHPAFTAAMLTGARATDKQWAKDHKAIAGVGGDLATFPMTGKYKALDIGRYLPPGAFSSGAGLHDIPSQILADFSPIIAPQVSDAFKAAVGLDAFGNPLSYPGPASKLTPKGRVSHATVHYAKAGQAAGWTALSDLLSAGLGPTATVRRIVGERGATPYSGTDQIWNPSPPVKGKRPPFDLAGVLAGINRVLNPVRPSDLTPRRKAKSLATRPGAFGGGGFGGGGGFSGGGFNGGGF